MGVLTIIREQGAHPRLAGSIYPVSPYNQHAVGTFEFEVLAADAGGLRSLMGKRQLLSFDDNLFWGELLSLEECISTVQGLALLRDRPALRGVMRTYPDQAGQAVQ